MDICDTVTSQLMHLVMWGFSGLIYKLLRLSYASAHSSTSIAFSQFIPDIISVRFLISRY